MKTIQKHFNSITEFNKYLCENETQPNFKGFECSQSEERENDNFRKTKTFEDANYLLLHGDKELAKKIEDAGVAKTRLKLKAQQTRRQLFSSVVGVAPNVPNALAGVPTSMISVKEIRCKTKVLNIFYNIAIDYTLSADTIVKLSAKFVSACMLLEAQGFRLNINAGCVCRKKGKQNIACSVLIKSASQPFDVLKMVYPLAHPSMLRRHFLRFIEVTEKVSIDFVNNYGVPVKHEETIKEIINNREKFNAVLSFYDINKEMTAEEVAKEIINRCK